ncbi:MAG: terminase family protein [Clostridia bacterium]|nr:terminase family protein [Clostridia bacterium]
MEDILFKLQIVENEIERRKKNDNLSRYNTGEKVHHKQMQFHKCTKRNRWVFGGNRSGKTECGAVETVWLARGNHPYKENKPVSCWVVSLSRQVQRDVAQAKILHYLRPDWIERVVMASGRHDSAESGVIDFILVKNVFGGLSKIGFKSCDQGREKFQGSSLDFVWFDEEPPYDIYQECRMRVIDRCGEVFGTMTPLKGLTWVYNEIYLNENNDDNVWHIEMEWADNPYLNEEEISAMTASMSEEELESRRYGKFMQCGGLVYNEFDENVHVIDPFEVPLDWQDTISIDPGLNNPLSAHWYAQDFDGNVYVVAEHYEKGKDVDYHARKIKEISNSLNWHTFNGKIRAIIDSAATQRTLASSKSVVDLFYENDILVNPKVNKDMFSGINRVKRYFKDADGKPHIFIFRNCTNLIKEIKGYWWGKEDVPIKKDDHSLDELRYYIMHISSSLKVKEIKTNIEKDKEKLIKNLKLPRFRL